VPLDVEFHEIDKTGTAGQERGARCAGNLLDRRGRAVGTGVVERCHGFSFGPPSWTSCTARTMFGYAPPADVPAHLFAHLVVGLRVPLREQPDRGADLAGRAVAALERIVLDERGLNRVQLLAFRQAFDRRHLAANNCDREREARVRAAPIEEHGAGATLAVVAPLLGAGQVEHLAQRVEKCHSWFDDQLAVCAVNGQLDRNGATGDDSCGWRCGRSHHPSRGKSDGGACRGRTF
jgi:hypothetical protein